ncbi:MAG: ATPase, T2SS/T4P/T4SS family [Verrucomicrobiota bacterium]
MSHPLLDRCLASANDFDASDLHLVAGVPPAFRVNGEIIIADEDTLAETDITAMADSLLNEQQRNKFAQEWELCISLLHPQAGRVRITFYRRNGHAEMSFRFCGERIASREELGLPERIDELARKPNGLVLITGPTGAGKTTTLNYLVDLINSERRCKIVTIEDPIEFVHQNKRAIVVQQEVLTDVQLVQSRARPRLAPRPRRAGRR